MKVHLEYGTEGLNVDIPSTDVKIITPQFVKGLENETEAFHNAVNFPINSDPLKLIINKTDKVAIVIPDFTRPLPSGKLLTWLFEELSFVPENNITIIIGTGTHRANSIEVIKIMVGENIYNKYKIINHNSYDYSTLEYVGNTSDGKPVYLNKEYVTADKRIVLGFIEPHFMAGFSGGYKGIFPAVADIDAIKHYHRASVINHHLSSWGILENNPTQDQIRRNGSLLPVDFCINVTLNKKHQITKIFCGETSQVHSEGSKFVKSNAMVECENSFPIVITTNAGYPLDQNLYQSVKGLSAAAQIVKENGLIIAASRCNDGFPSHGNFKRLLFQFDSPQSLLDEILKPDFSMHDQWQVQLLAKVLLKARVKLYSEIPDSEILKAHLEPIHNITESIKNEIAKYDHEIPIAVLPEGPMTIPFIKS